MLDPTLIGAICLALAGMAGFGAAATARPPFRPGLREALAELDLEVLEPGPWLHAKVHLGGVGIRIQVVPDPAVGAVLSVRGPPLNDLGLVIDGNVDGRTPADAVTGDTVFDGVVRVTGADPAHVLAVFDQATRGSVSDAVRAGAVFAGRWEVRIRADEPSADQVIVLVRAIARAHLALAAHRGTVSGPDRVVDRLHHDPAAGVRRRALALLLATNAATSGRLRPCLSDIDPEVRITAAERLGAWNVLLDVAREGTRSWRVRAAGTLARIGVELAEGERRVVRDALVRALWDPDLALKAVDALGALGGPDALAHLVAAARSGPPSTRASARRAVERLRARHRDAEGGLALAAPAPVGALALVPVRTDPPGEPPTGR